MFTGLVDSVGTIDRVRQTTAGRELRVASSYDELRTGESVAVSGVCLTVLEHGRQWFTVAAMRTTVDRTTIGSWQSGRRVNLERALRAGDPLGGHLVQGHVDAVADVTNVREAGDSLLVDVRVPPSIAELAVPRGSIAIDGVSLTISELIEPDVVRISLIEHTRRHTTLGTLSKGETVHVEGDIIGKYVQRLLGAYRSATVG